MTDTTTTTKDNTGKNTSTFNARRQAMVLQFAMRAKGWPMISVHPSDELANIICPKAKVSQKEKVSFLKDVSALLIDMGLCPSWSEGQLNRPDGKSAHIDGCTFYNQVFQTASGAKENTGKGSDGKELKARPLSAMDSLGLRSWYSDHMADQKRREGVATLIAPITKDDKGAVIPATDQQKALIDALGNNADLLRDPAVLAAILKAAKVEVEADAKAEGVKAE